MAEKAGQQVVEPKDSLSNILDGSRQVYAGHPIDDALPPDDDNDKGDNKDADPDAGKPPADDGGKKDEPKSDPPADTKFKHSTWEETEKARVEAEKLGHRKAEEAAEAKRKAEQLERQLEELKKAKDEKPKVEPPPAPNPEEVAARKQKVASLAKQFAALDSFSDDYADKAGELLAQMVELGAPQNQTSNIEATIQQAVEERLTAYREEQRAADERKQQEAETARKNQEAQDHAVKIAGDGGLNMKDGSLDSMLFWELSTQAPKDVPFEEQVDWTVKRVNTMKRDFLAAEVDKRASQTQQDNRILERGGTPPPPPKENTDAPLTFNGALERTMKARVV
jgi:hypothetical protein